MVINHSYIDGILVILLPLKLDTDSVPDIEADLKILMKSSFQNMLFDCSGMGYISSAGIKMLLSISKILMKSGKRVAFCSLKSNVRQIFDIGGFNKIFSIFDSQDAALKSLK